MYSIYMHNRVWRLRHTHYIIKKVNCLKKYELIKKQFKMNNSTSAKPTIQNSTLKIQHCAQRNVSIRYPSYFRYAYEF